MKSIQRVGIVAMPRISVGGGFARATRDLIAALNALGKEVVLLTPFHVDMKKISELYGPITIKKIFYPGKTARFFSRDDILGRKLITREFKRMAREVDFIIDLDGGVLHNYLPKGFDKKRYVIWRLSCINPETYKLQGVRNWKVVSKIVIKRIVKRLITRASDLPRTVTIYPLDEWTERELADFWRIPQKNMPFCLYPEIKVDEFHSHKKRKKQLVVLGRIASNKSIEDSIRIFHQATRDKLEYTLVILGGVTPDSAIYIKQLRQLARELGIERRVSIKPDPSFNEIQKTLSESEVLIDSQRGVSLTMTAIEAMASGCIVLAQKNGGTYQEILGKGKYGYGFSTVSEGGAALNTLLDNLTVATRARQRALHRAEFFSSRSFIKRLKNVLAY